MMKTVVHTRLDRSKNDNNTNKKKKNVFVKA